MKAISILLMLQSFSTLMLLVLVNMIDSQVEKIESKMKESEK